ncbi:MAG: hypothetical protein ACE5KU_06445, partial [Nitrososphaerales archaeon]
KKRGNLLIVERAWLSTYTVLAAYLKERVLSNVWWPVRVEDETAKILAVWLNSTFGLLLILSIAEVTRDPWVKFKKEHLWDMPILDVGKLDKKAKKTLLSLYDEVYNSELKSLPDEFANPSTRRTIDEEICKALGLDLKLDTVYKLLADEPMIKCR